MKGLPRLQASQRGYRAHVTKTFGRIAEITQSTEPVTPTQMISLRTALEQLQQRKVTMEEIDVKIANAIEDVTALEEEICEVEEYRTLLTDKITFLQDFISPPVTSPPTPLTIQPTSNTSDTEMTDEIRVRPPEPVIPPSPETTSGHIANHKTHVSDSTHRTTDTPHQNISRLPKLSLSFFSGGVWIQWNGMVDWNGGMEWWTGTVEWNALIGISSRCQLFVVTTQQFVYTSVGW